MNGGSTKHLLAIIASASLLMALDDTLAGDSNRSIREGFLHETPLPPADLAPPYGDFEVLDQSVVEVDFEVAVDALINGDFLELNLLGSDYLVSIEQTQPGSPGVVT